MRVGATLAVARIPTLPLYLTGDRKGRPYAVYGKRTFKFQFIEQKWSRRNVRCLMRFVTYYQRALPAKFQFIYVFCIDI